MPLPIPDFGLAPLQAVIPDTLVRDKDDRVGTLMLALAAAYNDLKGADYCSFQLNQMKAHAQSDTLERRGQFAGMGQQVVRIIMGIMHEILVELNESRTDVAAAEFQGYVQRLNKAYKADWDIVWAIATSSDRTLNRSDALSQILRKARNSVSFHYSRKALAAGYAAHFKANDPVTFSDRALVSIGQNMEETRFYYADAAAVAALSHVTGIDGESLTKQLSVVAQRLNRVLYALLYQFIEARSPTRTPYPLQEPQTPAQSKGPQTAPKRTDKNKAKRERRNARRRG